MTKEHRANPSKVLRGHKNSEETKRRMSENHKRKPKPRKHSNNKKNEFKFVDLRALTPHVFI